MTLTAHSQRLRCQKQAFSLPPDAHYLNCAYMSPLSKAVEAAGVKGVTRKSNPARISPADFFSEAEEVRRLFGEVVNAPPEHIALIPAVSYGVASVAGNLEPRAGQSVVVLHEQFPSHVYTWRALAAQGVTLKTVRPPTLANRAQTWNAEVLSAIDADTAVVALPHVHWADGTLFDLAAIGKRAREVGAALVIDATQSVGALPFDVAELQPDALFVGGYKTVMGPYGLGYAYYGERFLRGKPLEENWINRQGSEDFSSLVAYRDAYAPGARRFDVGERSNPILLPMMIAALGDILARGVTNVQHYCRELTRDVVTQASALGYALEHPDWRAHHLFGLRLAEGVTLEAVSAQLEKRSVAVSVRGDAVRISPNVYNDEADMAALLSALEAALP